MDTIDRTVLGGNILHYRRLRNMSQFDLSQAAGISQGHISLLENGKVYDVYLSRGLALARALGVTCEELMTPAENPNGQI